MKTAFATFAFVLLAICLIVGFPRVYGIGCEGKPFGFQLAQEEDELLYCRKIEALPLANFFRNL